MLRRTLRFGILAISLVFVLLAVVLSPLAMELLASWPHFDAKSASEVGGSYGAASALLSAIALCFLAFSAILQVRQTRTAQLQASRSLQLELLRMAIEKPEYRSALGSGFGMLPEEAWKQHAYINLWMMYLQMAFLTGAISEAGVLRTLSGELFCSAAGLAYWREADAVFAAEASSRLHRRFLATARKAYRVVLEQQVQSGAEEEKEAVEPTKATLVETKADDPSVSTEKLASA